MSALKQLKCPSCGAVLSISNPDQVVIECPYCHQQVVHSNAYKSAKGGEEPRILEFKLAEKDVVKRLVDKLVEDKNVPKDIFEKMKMSSTKQYYIPTYIFEGTYRAPWSARIERHERRQCIVHDKLMDDYSIKGYYETLYDYASGEAVGNFSFGCFPDGVLDSLCLSDEERRQHARRARYGDVRETTNISPISFSAFSQVTICEGIDLVAFSEDANYIWRKRGEIIAQGIGEVEAEIQAPGNLTSCSSVCELKKSWMVYIPIWIIRYEYKEKSYSYICYDYAEREEFISKPFERCDEDDEDVKDDNIIAEPTEEQQIVLNEYDKSVKILSVLPKIRNYGCLCIILFIFIGVCIIQGDFDELHDFEQNMLYVGIAFLVIMFVVQYIFNQYILNKENDIDDLKADIENRTRVLQKDAEKKREKDLYEAEQYRRETGQLFLNAFSGSNVENNYDVIKRDKDENH